MRAGLSWISSTLSRFATLIIIVVLALWFGTGSIIQGGQGPGKGERPVVAIAEPNGGPITNFVRGHGLEAKVAPDEANEPDPTITIAQREASTQGVNAPVRSVEVTTFTAQAMPINVPIRGQTKAKATVTAMAETTGTVATVNVTKGQTVKTGDLLCTLDPETRQAAVAQAEASLAQTQANVAQAQADYDTNQSLIKTGAATPNSARALQVALAAAKANQAAAQASVDNATTELGRTKVFAKTDGVVEDPVATVGSILNPTIGAATCATIVQLDPLVFSGSVPEARINYARTGLPASVTTVTGDTVQGKVTFVSAVSDPATRTFPAEIEIPNPGNKIPAGLSATATVNVGTAPAQLLPQSVLTLDDNGAIGIRAVDASDKVVFYPVNIVQDAREGMYVTGLPLKVDVITTGQEFVKAGDTVKPVQAKDNNGAPIPSAASTTTTSTTSNGTAS